MQRYKGEETQHCLLHTACQDIAQSPIYGNLMVDGGIFNLCLGEVLGQIAFRPGKNPATISSPPSSRHPLLPAPPCRPRHALLSKSYWPENWGGQRPSEAANPCCGRPAASLLPCSYLRLTPAGSRGGRWSVKAIAPVPGCQQEAARAGQESSHHWACEVKRFMVPEDLNAPSPSLPRKQLAAVTAWFTAEFPRIYSGADFAKQNLSLYLLPSGKSEQSLSGLRKIISARVAGL